MKSDKFTLNLKDFLKSLIMAGLAPVFLVIQQSIAAGDLVFNWKNIGMAAVAGMCAYLLKNFFTDSTKQAQNTIIDAAKRENIPEVTIRADKPGVRTWPFQDPIDQAKNKK